MKQNKYDDKIFFEKYSKMDRKEKIALQVKKFVKVIIRIKATTKRLPG